MKKNIAIAFLIVVSLLSFIYAFVQSGIAKENEKMAIENMKLLFQNEQRALAERKQLEDLRIQLEECQKVTSK